MPGNALAGPVYRRSTTIWWRERRWAWGTGLEIYFLNYQERRAQEDAIGQNRELNAAAKVLHDTCDFPAALVLLARCLTSWEDALGASRLTPAQARVRTEGLAQSLGALGETLLKLQTTHARHITRLLSSTSPRPRQPMRVVFLPWALSGRGNSNCAARPGYAPQDGVG